MAARLGAAVGAGAAIGAAAAYAYKALRGPSPAAAGFMTDGATTRLLPQRREADKRLDGLLRSAAPEVEACRLRSVVSCGLLDFGCRQRRAGAKAEHSQRLEELRRAAAAISYGPGAPEDIAERRDEYVRTYGCVAWTEPALDLCVACGVPRGIVEVGAGAGQWARALVGRGADVVAVDDGSSSPLPGREARIVSMGVDGAAAAAKHPQRTLLMVAPPPGPQAATWLAAYGGARVVYAGEGRGGAHADERFFDALERGWRVEATEPLRPFQGGAEKLWVLQRRT